MMSLKAANTLIFGQLECVLHQLNNEAYARPLDILSGNTIGKHVRHVVEFYELLVESSTTGRLNYDRRLRNLRLETDLPFACQRLAHLHDALTQIDLDRPVALESNLLAVPVVITSSYQRELLYNLEHAVHHLAILEVALRNAFNSVILPPYFGVAYSTVQYQNQI